MRLGFIDIAYDYTADRPDGDDRLGGTTSAVCFLTRELAAAGVGCTIFNTIKEPQQAHGIWSFPLGRLAEVLGNPEYSAFIFCGRWMEKMVRLAGAHTRTPLIAWMHESTFDAAAPVLGAFDGVVFVSEWQRRINHLHILSHWRQAVIRNAMNPKAAKVFAADKPILAAKMKPPILLYAGHFQRGAFHVPKILDHLRLKQKDFTMEIFSNTNPSQDHASNESYIGWLRGQPNIDHIGFVSQAELIRRMVRAAFFIAPNPWPETSCIALIEAMAAGLSVIATDRAALPETASGFARLVPIPDPNHPTRFDAAVPHEAFAAAIGQAMQEWLDRPLEVEHKLRAQVDYFLTHYQWSQRVAPWIEFVKGLKG